MAGNERRRCEICKINDKTIARQIIFTASPFLLLTFIFRFFYFRLLFPAFISGFFHLVLYFRFFLASFLPLISFSTLLTSETAEFCKLYFQHMPLYLYLDHNSLIYESFLSTVINNTKVPMAAMTTPAIRSAVTSNHSKSCPPRKFPHAHPSV